MANAAYYDFFRKIQLEPDGTTIEADSTTDTVTITRGTGVAFNANASNDSFEIDVDYTLYVPLGTTDIRLTDVNANDQSITLTAGNNIGISRISDTEVSITATVGGSSKAISNATQANPVVITTSAAHSFTEGRPVTITDVGGMTELNGNEYYMDILTSTTFALYQDDALTTPVNGLAFTPYTTGGVATGEYFPRTQLSELSDVDTAGVTTNQILAYDGTEFVPTSTFIGDVTGNVTGDLTGNITATGTLDGDLTGSVFADDSTVMVDAVNNHLVADKVITPLIEGPSNAVNILGTLIAIGSSHNITGTVGPVTIASLGSTVYLTGTDALYGIKYDDSTANIDLATTGTTTIQGLASAAINIGSGTSGTVTLGNGSNTVGFTSGTIVDFNGAVIDNFTATISGTLNGPVNGDLKGSVFADDSTLLVDGVNGIIPAENLSGTATIDVTGNVTGNLTGNAAGDHTGTFTGDLIIDGYSTELVQSSLTGTSISMSLALGSVGYVASPSGDITLNLTNVPTTDDRSISVSVILDQGATPYEITTLQIGGLGQTINWPDGIAPSGTVNGYDVFTFNLIRVGATWIVLGNMAGYA